MRDEPIRPIDELIEWYKQFSFVFKRKNGKLRVYRIPRGEIKMQGNQIVELTNAETLLSEALDHHFVDSNCDGTLVYKDFTADGGVFQFICEKCHEIIQL